MKNKVTLAVVTLTLCGIAQADTRIDTTDQRGERSTFTSNGKVARIDQAKEREYVLIDLEKHHFKMVDTTRQQIMVMDIKAPKNTRTAGSNRVRVDLNKVGGGPKIAGFSTEKYTLSANGRLCNTIYGSKSVLNKEGISEIFDAMMVMQQQSRNMMAGFRPAMDACTEANLQSAELFKTTGAPLRIIDANGQLESEVTAIDDIAVAANYYQAPANFQQISMQQQMNQAMQQNQQMMQQMQQNMPDMNQIMQQMQQSGMVPPAGMQRPQRMPPPGTVPGGGGEMSDLLKQIEEMQKIRKPQ